MNCFYQDLEVFPSGKDTVSSHQFPRDFLSSASESRIKHKLTCLLQLYGSYSWDRNWQNCGSFLWKRHFFFTSVPSFSNFTAHIPGTEIHKIAVVFLNFWWQQKPVNCNIPTSFLFWICILSFFNSWPCITSQTNILIKPQNCLIFCNFLFKTDLYL